MVSISKKSDSSLIQQPKKGSLTSVNISDSIVNNQGQQTSPITNFNLNQNFNDFDGLESGNMEINNLSIHDSSNGETSSLNDVRPKKKTDKFFDYLFWATLLFLLYKGWKLVKRYV